jgi:hypothetical protein
MAPSKVSQGPVARLTGIIAQAPDNPYGADGTEPTTDLVVRISAFLTGPGGRPVRISFCVGPAERFVSACGADPGKHERAGGDTGDAEGDQAWVGLVEAEDRPAGQLTQDEQPGSA